MIELRAVDERQALLRLEHDGLEPGAASACAGRHAPALEDALALADERERQVGERGEIAARADRALRRDERVDAAVEQRDQALERLEPDAGVALGEHVGAQQHQRARLGLLERRADARGVRAHQVHLQLAQAVVGDADLGEAAEAGGDAVDDVAARDRGVHDLSRGANGRAGESSSASGRRSRATASSPARSSEPPSITSAAVWGARLIGRGLHASTRIAPCWPVAARQRRMSGS